MVPWQALAKVGPTFTQNGNTVYCLITKYATSNHKEILRALFWTFLNLQIEPRSCPLVS